MVTFEHLLVWKAAAIIADASGLDRLEKGLAMVVLLLHKLGVVIELVQGRGNGQECSASKLEHGYNGLLEELDRDVGGLIDDDNVSACSTRRLQHIMVASASAGCLMGVSGQAR